MSIGMEIRMRAYIYCQQQFKSEKGRSILKVLKNCQPETLFQQNIL